MKIGEFFLWSLLILCAGSVGVNRIIQESEDDQALVLNGGELNENQLSSDNFRLTQCSKDNCLVLTADKAEVSSIDPQFVYFETAKLIRYDRWGKKQREQRLNAFNFNLKDRLKEPQTVTATN